MFSKKILFSLALSLVILPSLFANLTLYQISLLGQATEAIRRNDSRTLEKILIDAKKINFDILTAKIPVFSKDHIKEPSDFYNLIHFAALQAQSSEILQILIDAGANIKRVTYQGTTPLDLVQKRNDTAKSTIEKFFIKKMNQENMQKEAQAQSAREKQELLRQKTLTLLPHYQRLGLESTASREEINRAYRRLALLYHPDKQSGSKDAFQELQNSYEALTG